MEVKSPHVIAFWNYGKFLLTESAIRENFACGIWNPIYSSRYAESQERLASFAYVLRGSSHVPASTSASEAK